MNNGEISVTQALNQIQSWLNQGNHEKVIQGCQEILMLEPGNARALALLKRAEDKRHEEQESTPFPEENTADPLKELEVESPSETPETVETNDEPEEIKKTEREFRQEHLGGQIEKRKLFMALIIPAILVIVIGGAGIAYMNGQNRNDQIQDLGFSEDLLEQIEEEKPEEVIEPDFDYLEQNQIRVETLTDLGKAIEAFFEEEERYPSVDEIEDVLLTSKYFDELPLDPRQGEIDKRGKEYGYVYGTFTDEQGNDYYSMSALFEDSRGFAYPWNRGVSPRIFADYRNLDKKNVIKLGNE